MADAAFAKLLSLEAKGDVFEFDERFVPFVNRAPIDVVLHEVNEVANKVRFIGGVKIIPSAVEVSQ